jgi:anti-sigma regulatory factor (Ser/Thr protein kinase)
MSAEKVEKEIIQTIASFLPFGLSGYPDDFCSWVRMEYRKQGKDYNSCTKEITKTCLETLKQNGEVQSGKFDPKEYAPADKFLNSQPWTQDNYSVYGAFEFSPIQYVRSRLEYFLKHNGVSDLDLMDISIATIEGIENAAKYGDGELVSISANISNERKLTISITNTIKEFDLENEIERGKYSATTTLMRGIMVMQKLFNHLDLQIIEDKRQAKLYAEKILT